MLSVSDIAATDLRDDAAHPLTMLAELVPANDVAEALKAARMLGEAVGPSARYADRWAALSTLAARDLALARVCEPHLDALSILAESCLPRAVVVGAGERTWGVFAAEGGDEPLTAVRGEGGWVLTGVKPWCSLATELDAALVTARIEGSDGSDGSDERLLFSVELRQPGVEADASTWHARGLREIASGPVRFRAVTADLVDTGRWYLERPGFHWGAIGVAACWYGGAVAIARRAHAGLAERPEPHGLAHLGAIDTALQSARRALAEAAAVADGVSDSAGPGFAPDPSTPRVTAKRVRATVAAACDEILTRAGRALGPAPLALDAEHAKRVSDLALYIRQHHAERDLASLGSALVDGPAPW